MIASFATYQNSVPTFNFAISIEDLIHKFWAQNKASGRSVAQSTKVFSSPQTANLIPTIFETETLSISPSLISSSPTAFSSCAEYKIGYLPWTSKPASFNFENCHSINLLYIGSPVVNCLDQSIPIPIESKLPSIVPEKNLAIFAGSLKVSIKSLDSFSLVT